MNKTKLIVLCLSSILVLALIITGAVFLTKKSSTDEVDSTVLDANKEPQVTAAPTEQPLAEETEEPNYVAFIDFSTDEVDKLNLDFFDVSAEASEAFTEAGEIDGTKCRKVPSGKFLYLMSDRTVVSTTEENLIIDITYYDNSSTNLWFNYNSKTNSCAIADFAKSNSGDWVTTSIAVTDARLSGGLMGGSDFRMGYNGNENYIKSVGIRYGKLDPDAEPIPISPGTFDSEFTGKSFTGYQVWHHAGDEPGDWVHWAYGNVPGPGSRVNVHVLSFPDLSEFPDDLLYPTKFASLGNGRPTGLYNDKDEAVIDLQFDWLKEAEIDGVAIQRFVGSIGKSVTKSEKSYLNYIKNAAEDTGRLFYMCYDLNGSDETIVERMKTDWVYEIEQARAMTSSPNYATVDGKPVVEIWGIGYDLGCNKEQTMEILEFFHSRGCYVIGGTPRGWRTNSDGAMADYTQVYQALDCISPWTVGVYSSVESAANYLSSYMIPDKGWCDENQKDYLPVVFAGSGNWLAADGSFSQVDRAGGKLLWQQIVNAKSLGLTSVYFAMLDEFEESTNLINGAVDYFDIPTDQYFETFAKDGIWVSSDYYLRLAATASKMLRGEIETTETIPIPYSNGPIYFRNSFEYRSTTFTQNGQVLDKVMQIDPCFFEPSVISASGVSNQACEIIESPITKHGLYAAKLSGKATGSASYYFKTSTVKIEVKEGMELSFSRYAENDLGCYTGVDLLFSDGTRLSEYNIKDTNNINISPKNPKGSVGSWYDCTTLIGQGELTGKTITAIILGYENNATGDFSALFDDILIQVK
ncbi:MAG: hypothetical protein K0S47_356 [Herbinix sp.]|jgi:hypothetical protein|nr:hypothetical protein [Herbinix sp.]